MIANEAILMHEAKDLALSKEAIIVRDALIKAGLETPMVANGLTDDEKRKRIQNSMRDIMQTLGLDLSDDSLQDTPRRIAKMYTSTCEHHFVTIDGTASVAYIPKDTVIGLSKINRLVGFFAQRPQVQERLTQQVMVALQALTGTQDVAVSIHATHYCVKARGIRDTSSYTRTSSLGGAFKKDTELRRVFFS